MNRKLDYVKGFTFQLHFSEKQSFAGQETAASLLCLKESTGINTVVIALGALQDTAHSEQIDFTGRQIPSDGELERVITFAQKLGLHVFLKPMVNCRNGEWRAFINFFDKDVPCEPKWSVWFQNYARYLLHYAHIAEKTGCEMLIIGCELVMSERQESAWRKLIQKVRKVYSGLLTYNTDKYQEDQVKWWDALDVISSSGYYPENSWEENLNRIGAVAEKYQKPFFFAECGCPSRTGSAAVPNNWLLQGAVNLKEQEEYYREMFLAGRSRGWLRGYVCWDWVSNYTEYPIQNDGYSVYGKPACHVIHSFYSNPEDFCHAEFERAAYTPEIEEQAAPESQI